MEANIRIGKFSFRSLPFEICTLPSTLDEVQSGTSPQAVKSPPREGQDGISSVQAVWGNQTGFLSRDNFLQIYEQWLIGSINLKKVLIIIQAEK